VREILTLESFISSCFKSFCFLFFFLGVLALILRGCWSVQIDGFDLLFDLLLFSVTNGLSVRNEYLITGTCCILQSKSKHTISVKFSSDPLKSIWMSFSIMFCMAYLNWGWVFTVWCCSCGLCFFNLNLFLLFVFRRSCSCWFSFLTGSGGRICLFVFPFPHILICRVCFYLI